MAAILQSRYSGAELDGGIGSLQESYEGDRDHAPGAGKPSKHYVLDLVSHDEVAIVFRDLEVAEKFHKTGHRWKGAHELAQGYLSAARTSDGLDPRTHRTPVEAVLLGKAGEQLLSSSFVFFVTHDVDRRKLGWR